MGGGETQRHAMVILKRLLGWDSRDDQNELMKRLDERFVGKSIHRCEKCNQTLIGNVVYLFGFSFDEL